MRWALQVAYTMMTSLSLSSAFQVDPLSTSRMCSGLGLRRGTRVTQKCVVANVALNEGKETLALKSWHELKMLSGRVPDSVIIGDTLQEIQDLPKGLILFRDRNGWCPYSERVWLAMLTKQLEFDEVLINLQGSKPPWYSEVNPSGQTPCVRTAEGRVITESTRIIQMLDEMFPTSGQRLFPQDAAKRKEAVELMNSFSSVFPSGTRPSSRGSFLYKGSRALARSEFEGTLDKAEALLGRHPGPFFMGDAISGVDCAFAPFFERWSHQVPALIAGLETRDPTRWPLLAQWYDALEEHLPAYSHRVQGDRHTWRQALAGAGGGDTSIPDDTETPEWLEGDMSCSGSSAKALIQRVPALAPSGATASQDAAARLLLNHAAVVSDAARRALGVGAEEAWVAEGTLRAAAQLLLGGEGSAEVVGAGADVRGLVDAIVAVWETMGRKEGEDEVRLQVQKVAKHVGSRICTPRDMGALPALRLRQALAAIHHAARRSPDSAADPSVGDQEAGRGVEDVPQEDDVEGKESDKESSGLDDPTLPPLPSSANSTLALGGTSGEKNETRAGWVAPANGRSSAGAALDLGKLLIKWKAGERGSHMVKGGFGYVYFGVYDASHLVGVSQREVRVVVKLPTADEDAVRAFEREARINVRIASFAGMPGVAEYLGAVDLSGVEPQQLPGGIGGKTALVWRQVMGKTLDTYFDRRGGMSPVLARTLGVQASPPVKLPSGQLSYIKVDLAINVMGHVLLTLARLHAIGIIHRDLKPQNLVVAEGDLLAPLRVIDLGSAVLEGQQPLMEDFTEIYAPPEAPQPDAARPDGYDIYTVGVIGLRALMPALLAGDAGVQTLGKVTCAELPALNHDFRRWCAGRAYDTAAFSQDMPLNTECLALMQLPELFELLADMLAREPSARPTALACLERLGPLWTSKLTEHRFPLGHEIPLLWQCDVEWAWGAGGRSGSAGGGDGGGGGESETSDGGFRVGESVVVKRSDGKLKFAIIKSVKSSGKYDVTVEPTGAFQKDLPAASLGRILLQV